MAHTILTNWNGNCSGDSAKNIETIVRLNHIPTSFVLNVANINDNWLFYTAFDSQTYRVFVVVD